MAQITPLKETDFEYIVLVTGTTQETNTKIVDASALANAIPGPSNLLHLREVFWSVGGSGTATLIWEASPNVPFLYLSGTRLLELADTIGTKIKNSASGATGDILLTTSAAVPYTLILVLEKVSGYYDKTNKFNF